MSQATRAAVKDKPKPGHWLDRVIAGQKLRLTLLERALPFVREAAANGSDDALKLSEEILRALAQ